MKEALKTAIECLKIFKDNSNGDPMYTHAIKVLEALAQPAQEPVAWSSYEYDGIHHKPVAWMDADGNVSDNNDHKCFPIPLYTITHPTPPQRKWVGLTDEDCKGMSAGDKVVAMWADRTLKEKNNGVT